jgi:hypothetical protein
VSKGGEWGLGTDGKIPRQREEDNIKVVIFEVLNCDYRDGDSIVWYKLTDVWEEYAVLLLRVKEGRRPS